MNQIVIDGIIGGLLFAVFSYCTTIFNENPEYLKITAFLWGVPLFYFYLVYITWSKSKKAMVSFTKHAVLGTYLTVIVMIVTLNTTHYSMYTVICINIILLLLFIFFYFYFRLYHLI